MQPFRKWKKIEVLQSSHISNNEIHSQHRRTRRSRSLSNVTRSLEILYIGEVQEQKKTFNSHTYKRPEVILVASTRYLLPSDRADINTFIQKTRNPSAFGNVYEFKTTQGIITHQKLLIKLLNYLNKITNSQQI